MWDGPPGSALLSRQCSGMRNRFPWNAAVVKAYVWGSGPGDILLWGIDWRPASCSLVSQSIPDAGRSNISTPCGIGMMYVDWVDSDAENRLMGDTYRYFPSADHLT